MSGPTNPGSPPPEVPPEVPPEFADAYRAAYERAMAEQGLGQAYVEPEHVEPEYIEPQYAEPEHVEPEYIEAEHVEPEHVEPEHAEPEHVEPEHVESDDVEAEVSPEVSKQDAPSTEVAPPAASRLNSEPEPAEDPEAQVAAPGAVAEDPRPEQATDQSKGASARGATARGPGADRATRAAGSSSTWFDRVRRSRWFVPILLALLAIALILGAYLVGRRLADQVDAGSAPKAESRVVAPGESKEQEAPADKTAPVAKPKAWDGEIKPIGGVRARTGCTSEPGVDASGQQVTYEAENLVDGDTETTWRCHGAAVGERIRLRLDEDVPVGEVGLVPGYAKTDDATGDDRYAENNRVTKVRWTIGDTEVVQRMRADPSNRSLRLLRVPRTTADRVELEILAVAEGSRDTTAISEIQLGRAE